jgi:uncharacterized protein (DUF433 family)
MLFLTLQERVRVREFFDGVDSPYSGFSKCEKVAYSENASFCSMIPTIHVGDRMMSKLITEVVNGEPYQYYPLGAYVVRAVGVCGGRPTFKYTRIEITGALDRLAAGESLDEIVAGYGGRVSREAAMETIQVVTSGFLQTLPALEPA